MDPLHIRTPLFESDPLSKVTSKKILLKMECFQPSGSFKIRGIGRLAQEAVQTGRRQLVSSSGGNAGLAAAYAGKKLGVPVTVFVPKTTNPIYLQRLELGYAKVVITGDVWDEANEAALEFVSLHKDAAYIPPFDHPTIWAGHASMIDEIVQQCDKPDAVIASVGGGGLLCGILEGMKQHGWLDVDTFTVETEGAASFAASLKAGELITLDKIDTVATTLGAKRVANKLFEWSQKKTITPITVSDAAAIDACRAFADDHRVLVEPACGAMLSAVYNCIQHPSLYKHQSILAIVCGGAGVSTDLFKP